MLDDLAFVAVRGTWTGAVGPAPAGDERIFIRACCGLVARDDIRDARISSRGRALD